MSSLLDITERERYDQKSDSKNTPLWIKTDSCDVDVGNCCDDDVIVTRGGGNNSQRRCSTPAVSFGSNNNKNNVVSHKKLCRVARGQRVVLGTTPPVFVAELRPSASSELLFPTSTVTVATTAPEKTESRIFIKNENDKEKSVTETTILSTEFSMVKASKQRVLDAQDSDPCYSSAESEHSALSRNTSEASETLAQECANSPTLTMTTVKILNRNENSKTYIFAASSSDFSKLSLQDSGYSGSFPLCSSNSETSILMAPYGQQQQQENAINADYYASLLEFTLKLGYNETQLRSVLCKLASPTPGQDKVLAELIKLGQDVQDLQGARQDNGGGATSENGRHAVLTPSNSISNASNAGTGLRAIVVDGSNVAMTHGNKVVFSCLGIRSCIDWFRNRGHTDIKVFVPHFRKESPRSDNPITDQHILFDLEQANMLIWTPSRRLNGRRIICHDDRYILKTAAEKDAVIVSNDEYRDLINENSDFRKAVEERLLMYNFIDGKFVVPDDPLGRYGPKLDQFLSKIASNSTAPLCPYGKKCTYGNKCKFFHPERPGGLHKSVTERLRDHAEMHRRISPTSSLQYGRLNAADSIGELSYGVQKHSGSGKSSACRTQSLNPAALLRQNSPSPGRQSPNSSTSPLSTSPYQKNHQNRPYGSRVQHLLQTDGAGHVALAKQMSNPEARNFFASQTRNNQKDKLSPRTSMGVYVNNDGFLMPPTHNYMRQIWHQQHPQPQQPTPCHPVDFSSHPPIARNMSAPGVNMWQRQQQMQFSSPFPPPPYIGGHGLAVEQQRKNSVSDSQLHLVGFSVPGQQQSFSDNDDPFSTPTANVDDVSNFFVPSTTVWGPVEHSSSPVFTSASTTSNTISWTSGTARKISPNGSDEPTDISRSKAYYHLSQLFPVMLVNAVMRAHPAETDPQKLCSLILAARNNEFHLAVYSVSPFSALTSFAPVYVMFLSSKK